MASGRKESMPDNSRVRGPSLVSESCRAGDILDVCRGYGLTNGGGLPILSHPIRPISDGVPDRRSSFAPVESRKTSGTVFCHISRRHQPSSPRFPASDCRRSGSASTSHGSGRGGWNSPIVADRSDGAFGKSDRRDRSSRPYAAREVVLSRSSRPTTGPSIPSGGSQRGRTVSDSVASDRVRVSPRGPASLSRAIR